MYICVHETGNLSSTLIFLALLIKRAEKGRRTEASMLKLLRGKLPENSWTIYFGIHGSFILSYRSSAIEKNKHS